MSVVVDQLLRDARTQGLAAALANRKREVHAYLAPSDEPLGYDHTGVIRLDVAIHAIHLAAARVAIRALPGFFRQKVETLRRSLVEFVALKAAGFILFAALKRLLSLVLFVVEFFQAVKLQTELESAIRRGVLRTIREVPKLKLKSKGKRVRRVKRVASRHADET